MCTRTHCAGEWERGVQVLTTMRVAGVAPDARLYSELMAACSAAGRQDIGVSLWQLARSERVACTEALYTAGLAALTAVHRQQQQQQQAQQQAQQQQQQQQQQQYSQELLALREEMLSRGYDPGPAEGATGTAADDAVASLSNW
jgi:transcription initiation factor TFIID subunit TAF12